MPKHKIRSSTIVYKTLFIIGLILLSHNFANAEILYSQPDYDSTDNSQMPFNAEARTALQSQSPNYITLWVLGNGDPNFTIEIDGGACNDINTYNWDDYGLDKNALDFVKVTLPISYTFPSDMTTCRIRIDDHGGYNGLTLRKNTTAGSPPAFYTIAFCTDADCPLVNSTSSQITRILLPYTPINNTITASTSVAFYWQYYFNCVTSFGVYDRARIEITDVTIGSTTQTLGAQLIDICGTGTFSKSFNLVYAHQYLWRPMLYLGSNPAIQIAGNYQGFFVGTTTLEGITFNPAIPTITGSSTNFLGFLNVPQLMNTKAPFAYVAQMSQAMWLAIDSTTTNSVGSWIYDLKLPGQATTSIVFFGTSTITYYLPPATLSLWRSLVAITYYVGFAFFAFRRIQGII